MKEDEVKCFDCEVVYEGTRKRCPECKEAKAIAKRKAREARYGIAKRARYGELKRACVRRLGGKCIECGYNRYISAMAFHHVGRKSADVGLLISAASQGGFRSLRRLVKELRECVLLCHNCHMALHSGELRAFSDE